MDGRPPTVDINLFSAAYEILFKKTFPALLLLLALDLTH